MAPFTTSSTVWSVEITFICEAWTRRQGVLVTDDVWSLPGGMILAGLWIDAGIILMLRTNRLGQCFVWGWLRSCVAGKNECSVFVGER
jgi:hypothetical protein